MELRQLRYFVAVAEELHFRRAAARPAHLPAAAEPADPPARGRARLPAAGAHPAAGRADPGGPRRSCATPAQLLAELDGAVQTARRIDAGQTGRLRVNFVGSALLSIVPGIVQRFRATAPDVEIELHERPTVEQLRLVSAGVVDVGLVRPPIEELAEVRAEVVLRERSVAVLPAGHELAQLRRVSLQRLAVRAAGAVPPRAGAGFPRPADEQHGRRSAPTRT